MRRLSRLGLALLAAIALIATTAHAGPGLGLRWSNCFLDGGILNRNFACNTNTGTNVLVGSFVLAAPMSQASGNEMVIDLAVQDVSLPGWWSFKNVGSCRQTSMNASFFPLPTAVNCLDWASGQAVGGVGAYHVDVRGPATARILLVSAVPLEALADLVTGVEYFSFVVSINNAKTVGTGACAGCGDPVCLTLSSINVTTPIAGNNQRVVGAINGTDSWFATWQGPGIYPPNMQPCPHATPTKQQTWGAVKALYR